LHQVHWNMPPKRKRESEIVPYFDSFPVSILIVIITFLTVSSISPFFVCLNDRARMLSHFKPVCTLFFGVTLLQELYDKLPLASNGYYQLLKSHVLGRNLAATAATPIGPAFIPASGGTSINNYVFTLDVTINKCHKRRFLVNPMVLHLDEHGEEVSVKFKLELEGLESLAIIRPTTYPPTMADENFKTTWCFRLYVSNGDQTITRLLATSDRIFHDDCVYETGYLTFESLPCEYPPLPRCQAGQFIVQTDHAELDTVNTRWVIRSLHLQMFLHLDTIEERRYDQIEEEWDQPDPTKLFCFLCEMLTSGKFGRIERPYCLLQSSSDSE
jgi:hypothetical protein